MSAIAQRSFASGELTPALYARCDTTRYATGARTMRNCYILRSGGSENRAGTSFIGEIKDSSKAAVLIPFVFSTDQTYQLEFGDQYMRVIKQGEYVTLAAQNITAITNANPCVVTYSGSDTYSNGDVIYVSGIVGAIGTYLNGRDFKVSSVNTGTNSFTLQYMDATNVNSTSMGAYTSGGTLEEVYTISTPYAEADLPLLQYSQSADVVTITHSNYAIRELRRTADASWTLTAIGFDASIGPPTLVSPNSGGVTYWAVTALDVDTGEESTQFITPNSGSVPSVGTPITLQFGQPATGPRAGAYNVYRLENGGNYFIGNVADSGTAVTKFVDSGIAVDPQTAVPEIPDIYNAIDKYPAVVGIVQQRRAFANTNTNSEEVRLSKAGSYRNFSSSNPIADDDAIKFTMTGQRVNAVRHIVEVGTGPVVFTQESEVSLEGDGGILTPSAVNPKTNSRNGASTLMPLVVDSSALYVQARGSAVRDLNFDYQVDGYRGNELSISASHLVDGYEITSWCYQKIPHSVVWAVRNDGVLLSLTYVRDQQIFGWAHHDLDGGIVECVSSVPEGAEDAVYMIVQRTVDGRSVRYVERLNQRRVDLRNEMVFMDSMLSFDGRHTGSTTMTLSGGTTWAYDETLTLTASASFFASTYVGNEIHLENADGEIIRFEVTGYTSATVVTGRPNRTVPASMRTIAIGTWTRAVDQVSGLWHLEGKDVSILGDGYVVASPNNSAYDVRTVVNGSVDLGKCYGVIYVGLPYISDVETLDIDQPEGASTADQKKLITKVTAHLYKSLGMFFGREAPAGEDPLENLYELKVRNNEDYDVPTELVTDKVEINIQSNWNTNGRIFIRQVDPLPMSVLAVAPGGIVPQSR